MKAYINKAAVVAEIDRLQEATMDKNQNFLSSYHEGIFDGLSMLENFLDTLEVKEVQEEPVSNDLKEAAHLYVDTTIEYFDSEGNPCCYLAFKAGAQWQKERILNNATEREVKVDVCGYPYIDFTELYDYDKDIPLAKEGDKVKLVIIEEDKL